jgi:CheY-like chemotaxis protein
MSSDRNDKQGAIVGTSVEYSSQNEIRPRHRVLIVEDELFIALDLEETVKAMGFDVAGLANGQDQALQLASLADIAFVDVNLSDGPTGPEIGRRLVEEFGVTVVFMTGNPEAVADRLNGALGVVTKPAMPSTVERTLKQASEARISSN